MNIGFARSIVLALDVDTPAGPVVNWLPGAWIGIANAIVVVLCVYDPDDGVEPVCDFPPLTAPLPTHATNNAVNARVPICPRVFKAFSLLQFPGEIKCPGRAGALLPLGNQGPGYVNSVVVHPLIY
jgi:hypothetical protein